MDAPSLILSAQDTEEETGKLGKNRWDSDIAVEHRDVCRRTLTTDFALGSHP